MPRPTSKLTAFHRKSGRPGKLAPVVTPAAVVATPVVAVFTRCPEHTSITYRTGGFCQECFREQTEARVKVLDDGFSTLAEQAITRLTDILRIPVDGASQEQLKVVLGPVLRAVDMVARRHQRPDKVEVTGHIKSVHLVGTPMDFRKTPQAAIAEGGNNAEV